MSREKCQRCGEVDYDRRTLSHRCFYDMSELKLPFEQDEDRYFNLRVCKSCRADWMQAIKDWFNNLPEKKESIGSGIFVRINGDTVEVSEEEFWKMKEAAND